MHSAQFTPYTQSIGLKAIAEGYGNHATSSRLCCVGQLALACIHSVVDQSYDCGTRLFARLKERQTLENTFAVTEKRF